MRHLYPLIRSPLSLLFYRFKRPRSCSLSHERLNASPDVCQAVTLRAGTRVNLSYRSNAQLQACPPVQFCWSQWHRLRCPLWPRVQLPLAPCGVVKLRRQRELDHAPQGSAGGTSWTTGGEYTVRNVFLFPISPLALSLFSFLPLGQISPSPYDMVRTFLVKLLPA